MFLWLGLYSFATRFSIADILNIMFLGATLYAMHSGSLRTQAILPLHSAYCFLAVPVVVVLNMWIDVGYLTGLGLFVLFTFRLSVIEVRERT